VDPALKGRKETAQGNALGWLAMHNEALKGRYSWTPVARWQARVAKFALSGLGMLSALTQGVALGYPISPPWGVRSSLPQSPPLMRFLGTRHISLTRARRFDGCGRELYVERSMAPLL